MGEGGGKKTAARSAPHPCELRVLLHRIFNRKFIIIFKSMSTRRRRGKKTPPPSGASEAPSGGGQRSGSGGSGQGSQAKPKPKRRRGRGAAAAAAPGKAPSQQQQQQSKPKPKRKQNNRNKKKGKPQPARRGAAPVKAPPAPPSAAELAAAEAKRVAAETAARELKEAAEQAAAEQAAREEAAEQAAREEEARAQMEARRAEQTALERSRDELRQENAPAAVAKARGASSGKLKGDIKKTEALIKKCRMLNASNGKAICDGVAKLKLSRYVSEIANAIVEATGGKLGGADIAAFARVASAMHQRYDAFIVPLQRQLRDACVDQALEPRRRRNALRAFAELYLCGLFSDVEIIAAVVRALVTTRKQAGKKSKPLGPGAQAQLVVLVSFLRHGGEDFLAVLSRKQQEHRAVEEAEAVEPIERVQMVSDAARDALREEVLRYFDDLSALLVKQARALRKREKVDHTESVMKGELSKERAEKTEKMKGALTRMHANAIALSDALQLDLPREITEAEEEEEVAEGELALFRGVAGADGSELEGPFEDERTRSFYEDLPDVRAMVPAALLAKSLHEAKAAGAAAGGGSGGGGGKKRFVFEGDYGSDAGVDDEGVLAPPTALPVSVVVENILEMELPECVNGRDVTDAFSAKFMVHMSRKAPRSQLIASLYAPKRSADSSLMYYSRVAATFACIFPDIGPPLVKRLRGAFHFHAKKKDQSSYRLGHKLRNVKYIAELTKFRVAPPIVAFGCLQQLLRDFRGHNIEVAATLLDGCGRFLYRQPETHPRCKVLLETMMRLKNAKNVDESVGYLVENAYWQCVPHPKVTKIAVKVVPPLHRFVISLFMTRSFGRKVADRSAALLRRLPWEDPSAGCVEALVIATLRVTKGRSEQVRHCCSVLRLLYKWRESAVLHIVDQLLEVICADLDSNDFRQQQRRVGQMRLLGELYIHRLVTSSLVFDVLDLLIESGHDLPSAERLEEQPQLAALVASVSAGVHAAAAIAQSRPNAPLCSRVPGPPANHPSFLCECDPPQDSIRIRLACTLLNVVARYFCTGQFRSMLEDYLTRLQRYALAKWMLPLEVEYMLSETLDALLGSLTTKAGGRRQRGGRGAAKSVQQISTAVRKVTTLPEAEVEVQFALAAKMEAEQKAAAAAAQKAEAVAAAAAAALTALEPALEPEPEEEEEDDGDIILDLLDDCDDDEEEEVGDEEEEEEDEAEEGEEWADEGDDLDEDGEEEDEEDEEDEEEDDDDEEENTFDEAQKMLALAHQREMERRQAEANAQFEDDFRKMMRESTGKSGRSLGVGSSTSSSAATNAAAAAGQMAIPVHLLSRRKTSSGGASASGGGAGSSSDGGGGAPTASGSGRVMFRMLKRHRGKIEVQNLAVPSDARIVMHRQEQKRERDEERLALKRAIQDQAAAMGEDDRSSVRGRIVHNRSLPHERDRRGDRGGGSDDWDSRLWRG